MGSSGPHHPGSTWKVTEEKGRFPDVGVIPGCWGDWFCDTGKTVGTGCQWCEHQLPRNWRKSLLGGKEAGTVPPGSCLGAHSPGSQSGRWATGRVEEGGGAVTRLLLVFSRSSQMPCPSWSHRSSESWPRAWPQRTPATRRWPGSS